VASRTQRVVYSLSAAIVCATLAGVVSLVADAELSQRAADAFQRKVDGIKQYASSTLTGARLTPVSESELNSYIRFSLKAEMPAGVVEPYVSIVGNDEVRARAVVDLDAVRTAKPRGWLDPLGYLAGRLPVTARGRLLASNGVARLELEQVTVSGVTVPNTFLQEIVTFYTRSPQNPNGVDLGAPFDLPARIEDINVEVGQAIVVQR
jgi:hypothetical protein